MDDFWSVVRKEAGRPSLEAFDSRQLRVDDKSRTQDEGWYRPGNLAQRYLHEMVKRSKCATHGHRVIIMNEFGPEHR